MAARRKNPVLKEIAYDPETMGHFFWKGQAVQVNGELSKFPAGTTLYLSRENNQMDVPEGSTRMICLAQSALNKGQAELVKGLMYGVPLHMIVPNSVLTGGRTVRQHVAEQLLGMQQKVLASAGGNLMGEICALQYHQEILDIQDIPGGEQLGPGPSGKRPSQAGPGNYTGHPDEGGGSQAHHSTVTSKRRRAETSQAREGEEEEEEEDGSEEGRQSKKEKDKARVNYILVIPRKMRIGPGEAEAKLPVGSIKLR